MNNRIIISGCSGGGKSTLIRALAELGCNTVEEAGRRVVETESRLKSAALPWLNMPLFLERAIKLAANDFDRSISVSVPVFYDRSLVDLILAYKHFTGSAKFDRYLETKRYSQTVFLAPPWEEIYVTDVARQHSFESAAEEYERLEIGYLDLGYDIEILPKTDVKSRVEFILNWLGKRPI